MALDRSVAFALLLVSMVFAGCLGGGGGDAKAPPTADDGAEPVKVVDEDDPLASLDVPTWTKGRYWTFSAQERNGDGTYASLNFSLAVVDDAAGYVLATDDRALAYRDATRTDLFFIGAFAKEDLAYVVGGAPHTMFQFPLEDQATWSGVDPMGRTITYRASRTDRIEVGDATYAGYGISGTDANGTLLYDFTYAPDAQWIASFTQYDPTIPTEPKHVLSLQLREFGESFGKDVVRMDTQWVFRKDYLNVADGNKKETVTVPAGLTELFAYFHISAGDGFWSDVRGYANVTIVSPDNEEVQSNWKAAIVPDATGRLCSWPTAADPVSDESPLNATISWCTGYTQNYTKALPAKVGDWTLLYTVATTAGITARIGVLGITETVAKPG